MLLSTFLTLIARCAFRVAIPAVLIVSPDCRILNTFALAYASQLTDDPHIRQDAFVLVSFRHEAEVPVTGSFPRPCRSHSAAAHQPHGRRGALCLLLC